MRWTRFLRGGGLSLVVLAAAGAGVAQASAYGDRDSGQGHVVIRTRSLHLLSPGEKLDPRIARTDIDYASNMRRHHQGAVDMSRLYLDDPQGSNPVLRRLARSIIANQEFEMRVLENVRHAVEQGPKPVLRWGDRSVVALERGVDGLEHSLKYNKSPPPSLVDIWLTPGFAMSAFDVQFARPMVEHHEAALTMARAYNTNPLATNTVLRDLNVEILVDQAYEIRFLRALLAATPAMHGRSPTIPA